MEKESINGFSIANLCYRYSVQTSFFEYQAIIRTRDPRNVQRLSEALTRNNTVREFNIAPTDD